MLKFKIGASRQNRTDISCVEDSGFTTKLCPIKFKNAFSDFLTKRQALFKKNHLNKKNDLIKMTLFDTSRA